jgi:hypothetical protein
VRLAALLGEDRHLRRHGPVVPLKQRQPLGVRLRTRPGLVRELLHPRDRDPRRAQAAQDVELERLSGFRRWRSG